MMDYHRQIIIIHSFHARIICFYEYLNVRSFAFTGGNPHAIHRGILRI